MQTLREPADPLLDPQPRLCATLLAEREASGAMSGQSWDYIGRTWWLLGSAFEPSWGYLEELEGYLGQRLAS